MSPDDPRLRVAIVSDAWFPQVNGVVRTLSTLSATLEKMGHAVMVLGPDKFRSVPCPSYPEIRLALCGPRSVGRFFQTFRPSVVHIATEGPLGLAARAVCRSRGWPHTSSFHTRFPEYVHVRWFVPLHITYAYLRWFHGASARVMVSTPSVESDLVRFGFKRLCRWSRGVDTALFHPRPKDFLPFPRPISLYVGRVAPEKGVEDFLRLDLPGTKVVVGDGPDLRRLRAAYPAVRFVGVKTGETLACHYAAADVFVFPSRTDTFGLVILEALASGLPVAAFPVPGPRDILPGTAAGALNEDLGAAVREALTLSPDRCRALAESYSWENCARQFLANVEPIPGSRDAGE